MTDFYKILKFKVIKRVIPKKKKNGELQYQAFIFTLKPAPEDVFKSRNQNCTNSSQTLLVVV